MWYSKVLLFLFLSEVSCTTSKYDSKLTFEIREKNSGKVSKIIAAKDIQWFDIKTKSFRFSDSINTELKKFNYMFDKNKDLVIYLNGKRYLDFYLQCNCGNFVRTEKTKVYMLNNYDFIITSFSRDNDSIKFNVISFYNQLKALNKIKRSQNADSKKSPEKM